MLFDPHLRSMAFIYEVYEDSLLIFCHSTVRFNYEPMPVGRWSPVDEHEDGLVSHNIG